MPTTPVLGGIYPTPLDPATADLWGDTLNDLFLLFDGEFGTRTVNQNFADFVLSRSKLKDTSETAYSAGNISGAVSLDYTNGSYQYATLTGNVSGLTITNWPASGSGGWMTLELIQDGTGSRTLTLGSAYKTQSGDTVTLTTTASARDKLYLQTRDAGTTIDVTPAYNWS
jgi:hypothetical protein